ncbi:MAG: right-handed parallel beta-helix repeat-containing protein [Candidatus Cloacimonetes bacterium]|nr:right-handed parallel beta-helix repeat-containing protein [Candidatus Cloacimonadota bacterium]
MKKRIALIITFIIYLAGLAENNIIIDNTEELQSLFISSQADVTINLGSGDYYLQPTYFIDETCGNCEDVNTPVPATYGLKISGKNVKLQGPADRSAVIHTNSGFGIYVVNCQDFYLENITLTEGIRDTSGMASDAAIVVKNSSAFIRNNLITGNQGDSLMIARNISGIMGICGRENSYLEIMDNEITNNSWDGIALYRDAEALITGNIIDGGRGVAIGVTWNAKANINDNYLARYWKGIGLFVDAEGSVQNNIIEDMYTWGLSLWDAGKGKPKGHFQNNIVYDTGAMGAAITSSTEESPGYFRDNIIVQTAQNPAYDSPDYYGYQCAMALHAVPPEFEIDHNLFYDNRRATEDLPDFDVSETEFQQKLQEMNTWISKLKYIEKSEFEKKMRISK